jgi:hypothetical protein
MEKFQKYVFTKWAQIVAFVPIANLAHLILYFLFIKGVTKKFENGILVVALILGAIAYRFLPGNWGWVVTYGLTVVFSYLALMQIRKYGVGTTQLSRKKVRQKGIILFIATGIFVIFVFAINAGSKIAPHIESVLNAISSQNMEQWELELHPQCNSELQSLERFTASLEEKGVQLSGAVEKMKQTGFSYEATTGSSKTEGKFLITMGGEKYFVTALYIKDQYGEGITYLEIDKD